MGDIIVPSPVERALPVLLPEFERPKVLTYSLESTVAEKLDAIISLMEATGRMKDFYYIYLKANYSEREISQLILRKNLYGLDIDDRAGQLEAFALMMKIRSKNRGIS